MLTEGKQKLLNALLDKYERGTGYVQGKRPIQRIKLNLYNKGKSDFKPYDIEKSEIRDKYNSAVLSLKTENLVDFKWMTAEEGHIIAEVWLLFEQLDKSYKLLERTPKGDTVDEALLLLMEVQEQVNSSWLLRCLDDLIRTISKRRSIGSLLPSDMTETKDLLHALMMADHLAEDEILERVFSIRCFGDSKRFESVVRSRFVRILKSYIEDVDDDAKEEEILRRVRIAKYPEQIEFRGAIQIELAGSLVNYAPLQYGATFNAKDIVMGKFLIPNSVKRVLFIENRANFVDYVFSYKNPEEFVVFHGGCYSPVKGLFFQKIKSAVPPDTEFYHWGDIDYGGFSMLARLRRNLIPSIKPYRMSEKELIKYDYYTITFEDSYLRKLEELRTHQELCDCITCLDYMISNRIRLEQEALIAVESENKFTSKDAKLIYS